MLISFTPFCKVSLHSRTSAKMPHRCPSVKSCVFKGASPANRSTDGEVVGVGDSVHFACYRGEVARAEDIVYANA